MARLSRPRMLQAERRWRSPFPPAPPGRLPEAPQAVGDASSHAECRASRHGENQGESGVRFFFSRRVICCVLGSPPVGRNVIVAPRVTFPFRNSLHLNLPVAATWKVTGPAPKADFAPRPLFSPFPDNVTTPGLGT